MFACNVGDSGSIPGLERCPGEGNGNPLQYSCPKIPWMEEPGRLQSMGSLWVRHDWVTSLSLFTFTHWRRKWQPTPVFLPGESQGWGSLVGCCLWLSMGLHRVGHDWSDSAAAAAAYTRSSRGIRNLHSFGAFPFYPTLVPGEDRDGWRHIRGRRYPWTYPARSVRIENWICHWRHALTNNYQCHGDALKRMAKKRLYMRAWGSNVWISTFRKRER